MAEVNLPKSPQQKPVSVQVVGQATDMQKQPLGKRLFHAFFMANSMKEIGDNLLFKVFVPQMQTLLEGLMGKGIHMLFFGNTDTAPTQTNPVTGQSFINYGAVQQTQASQIIQIRSVADFDMPILPTREMAETVIRQLREIIGYQGYASVAQLYTSVSRTPDWTDEYYGWRDLSAASAVPQADGRWLVSLPKAVRLT